MRLQTQVLLLLCILWVVFCGVIYVGAHHYLLMSLLHINGEGRQEVQINHYAFTQVITHYFILFTFISLFFAGLIWALLRFIFANQTELLLRFHHTLAEEVKNKEELNKKISVLEKRAKKSDLVDGNLHEICDHLNTMNTSLSLMREKISKNVPAEENDFLVKELGLLDIHFKAINEIIKSMRV